MFRFLNTFLESMNRFIVPFCHTENKGDYSAVPDLTVKVDDAFMLVLIISLVMLAIVTFFMVYFAVKYRASKNRESKEVKESLLLEITWTVIPTILVFVIFYVGWENFVSIRSTPENALPVRVISKMWSWSFEYENGMKSDTLIVPLGRPVKLTITSSDVIHSLYIPDLKLKEDAVPGMDTSLWIMPEKEGEYKIFCAEYCGQGHSAMQSKVIAKHENEFNVWYTSGLKKADEPADVMSILDDNGCLDCHSTDGSEIVGPTFKGIFGRKTEVKSDGVERTLNVDEPYLRESILHPEADIVKGYPEVMPAFEDEISEKELGQIIDYLKELK